eukprot:1186476-Prorocentrum_minimum.AAC.7
MLEGYENGICYLVHHCGYLRPNLDWSPRRVSIDSNCNLKDISSVCSPEPAFESFFDFGWYNGVDELLLGSEGEPGSEYEPVGDGGRESWRSSWGLPAARSVSGVPGVGLVLSCMPCIGWGVAWLGVAPDGDVGPSGVSCVSGLGLATNSDPSGDPELRLAVVASCSSLGISEVPFFLLCLLFLPLAPFSSCLGTGSLVDSPTKVAGSSSKVTGSSPSIVAAKFSGRFAGSA